MPIKVVIEFQAKPGARAELKKLLSDIAAAHGPRVPGYLGSTVYEALDSPDGLVEIADWDSPDAQEAAVQQAMAATPASSASANPRVPVPKSRVVSLSPTFAGRDLTPIRL